MMVSTPWANQLIGLLLLVTCPIVFSKECVIVKFKVEVEMYNHELNRCSQGDRMDIAGEINKKLTSLLLDDPRIEEIQGKICPFMTVYNPYRAFYYIGGGCVGCRQRDIGEQIEGEGVDPANMAHQYTVETEGMIEGDINTDDDAVFDDDDSMKDLKERLERKDNDDDKIDDDFRRLDEEEDHHHRQIRTSTPGRRLGGYKFVLDGFYSCNMCPHERNDHVRHLLVGLGGGDNDGGNHTTLDTSSSHSTNNTMAANKDGINSEERDLSYSKVYWDGSVQQSLSSLEEYVTIEVKSHLHQLYQSKHGHCLRGVWMIMNIYLDETVGQAQWCGMSYGGYGS